MMLSGESEINLRSGLNLKIASLVESKTLGAN